MLHVHSCRGSWVSSAAYREVRDGLASAGNCWESTPDSRSGDASGGPGLPPSATVTDELFLRSLSWPCPAGTGTHRVCEVLPPGAC